MSYRKKAGDKEHETAFQTGGKYPSADTTAHEKQCCLATKEDESDKHASDASSKKSPERFASGDTLVGPLHTPTSSKGSSCQQSSSKSAESGQNVWGESKGIGAKYSIESKATGDNVGTKIYETQKDAQYTKDAHSDRVENIDINLQGTQTTPYQITTESKTSGYIAGTDPLGAHDGTYQFVSHETESKTSGYTAGTDPLGAHDGTCQFVSHETESKTSGYIAGTDPLGAHDGTYQFVSHETEANKTRLSGSDLVYIHKCSGKSRGAYQDRSKVPWVTKEFVLYCQETVIDEWVAIKIFDVEITMFKSSSSDNIYKRKIAIRSDYPEDTRYRYEIKRPGYWYGTKEVQCKHKFKFDSRHVFRDCWKVSADAISAHLDDISNINVDLTEAYLQIETLPFFGLKQEFKAQLLSSISSNLNNYSKGKRNVILGALCFLSTVNGAFYFNKMLSGETARTLLKCLENLRLCHLPTSYHEPMPKLCTELCALGYDSETRDTADLYISYLFLGEQLFYDKLLSMRNAMPDSVYKQNIDFIAGLFMSIHRSPSFGNETSVKLIARLLKDLPYNLTMATYASLLEMKSEFESYEAFKEMIQKETVKRTEQKLKNLGPEKLKKVKSLWGTVLVIGDGCEAFKTIFEDCLVDLMKLPTLADIYIVVQIAKESILFSTPDSKLRLLKAVACSPSFATAKIFMSLAQLKGFADMCQSLDPLSFEHWYYNSADTRKNLEKRTMNVVCQRLDLIFSLKNVSEVQGIVDIARGIISTEMKKRSLDQVTLMAKEAIDATEDSTLLSIFLEQVSTAVKNTKIDVEKLVGPFLVNGVLQLKSKFIADILHLIMDEYGNTCETSSYQEQFFKAVDQRRLWTVIFKSEGSCKKILEGHPFFIRTSMCVRMIAEKLSKLEVDFKFMKYIHVRQHEVTDILSSFMKTEEIKHLIDWNQKKIHYEECRIKAVTSVLQSVKKQSIKIPDNFDEFSKTIDERVACFYKGEIEGNNCHLLWETIEQLPYYCLELNAVVTSVVYWNLIRDYLVNETSENESNIEDISTQDDQSTPEPEQETDSKEDHIDENMADNNKSCMKKDKSDIITWNTSIHYIEKMHSIGLKSYIEHMKRFLDQNELSMAQILHMFNCKLVVNPTGKSKPDLEMEKNVAESVIGITRENPTWDVLKQIYNIGEIKSKVEGMRSFLKVVQIDLGSDIEFASALESFEQLLSDNVKEYSFLKVKTALGMIYSIIDTLSDTTFEIMISVGKCSSLIDFLKETVDEDIRNLIDAVEDISEQQVRESTVSGLIEIKQILLPVLKPEAEQKCQQLLSSLEHHVKRFSRSTNIPAKVNDCMENLHNLKSLYNNVANRGEQTKQIVKNILDNGHFKFQLDENTGTVLLESRYRQNESLVTKKKAELVDLRSRSLLLMNAENKTSGSSNLSREQVETFVGYVDQCIDLSDLCTLLNTSGHYKYITIDIELKPSALSTEKEKLTEEFNDWEKELSEERNKYYLMNYIHGFGLHSMYQYLNMYESVSVKDRENLENTVHTILVFMHPEMKTKKLREMYFAEKTKCETWTSANWLNCLGIALHGSYPDTSSTSSGGKIVQQKGKSESLKMTDIVQEGKLFLAQLDENSLYTVRTVIALYANTVSRMPESHQVLFCTRETSLDEIELLLERCLGAKTFYGRMPLYCIANIELLPSELYSEFLDILRSIQEEYSHFLLALVCRGTNSHQVIDELSQFKTTVAPATDTFVKSIFKAQHENVVTLTSDLAGLGKSSRVTKYAHTNKKSVAVLHVSGCSRKAHLIERLNALKVRHFHVLHIDIGTVDDPKELDTFLFELLILGYVSVGRISVSLRTKHVYMEIANTINETLRNSLQTATLFSREHIRWQKFDDFVVSKEIQSAIQIVCKYFNFLDKEKLDKKDINLEESKPLSTKTCRQLLKKYLDTEEDMSFPVVSASLDVLADQFKKMTCSPFFRVSRLRDMTGNKAEQNVKSSLIKAMIRSTCEFASRSVSSCRATQSSTTLSDGEHTSTDSADTGDIATRVTQRIKGMIRWEESNHLMFVFHCQNIQTLSPLYRDKLKVPENIKDLFCTQMNKELQDFKALRQEQLQDLLQKIARDNPLPLPDSQLMKIAKGYALTPDNLLKMVLIMLRIKARVPVVIMGETGCGKTSLVRYLASICEVPFDVLNIHAGVPEKAIIESVQNNSFEASKSLYSERWLFLDEINTSESIGIMTEIICHHKCLGKSLPPNLVVMGACNPYKLRSKKDIATAGLTLKSQNDELSRLVYRVLPLPEMMVDYVWDFGSLNENDEKLYVKRMVDGLFTNEKFHSLFSDMLSVSQSFVRMKEESACVVSLRDINRCRLLTEWFMKVLCNKTPRTAYTSSCDRSIRAMILALAHCYHSRFPSKDMRADYRKALRAKLKEYDIEGFDAHQDKIYDMINEEQRDFISRMELPDGTACNTALMENVFVIIVCIYNRLPVFVVGKPGCSKSLAMQIIRSNLRGKDSKDIFFKTLPQLYCVSFQGSESSSSDGILKVFAKAENYQSSNSADDVLSVVILDEIGLAEVSGFNPLKVLHNLLEPDGEMRPNVAVVGLSNWALDASKMNRAIHLSRTDMDEEELYETAKAISESFATRREKKQSAKKDTFLDAIGDNDETEYEDFNTDIKEELKGISKSYHDYSQKLRFKNFHGLRDYYALVKYVARILTSGKTYMPSVQLSYDDTAPDVSAVVKSGLERNFGGLPSESSTLYEIFNGHFNFDTHLQRNVLDLIAENVGDHLARHLMLITSGDSSLGILDQQLNRIGRSTKEVIFGSQFEDDLTDDYNYRILSRIILCMEEGMILILKDLENIYGSLYDMLNQNYTIIGNKKNCRIALGAYSNPICQVGNTFRCIVLMDERKVKSCDPPFLNRFEKQYLRFSDVLNTEQYRLVNDLQTWICGLRDIQERVFDYTDVFPVYGEDLLPSLVLKTERECERTDMMEDRFSYLCEVCKRKLIWILKPEAVIRLKRAISDKTAAEADSIKQTYYDLPLHRGLEGLISFQLFNLDSMPEHEGILTIVFTNSNMHISLQRCISRTDVQIERLSTFKSEKQVSTKIQHFWSKDTSASILFVQCSAVDDEKHIILTKSIVERHRTAYQSVSQQRKHVYLIIHAPANKGLSKVVSQIHFMSDWNLVMLDSLEPPRTDLPKLCNMDILEAIENKRPLDHCLMNQLFWAFTRIKYSPLGRDVNSIKNILAKIKTSPDFLQFLGEEIWRIVSEMEIQERDWQTKVACDMQALRNSSSFVDALEQHIMKVIKIPLTKLIFCMEKTGVLESYFINDSVSNDRRKVWMNLIHDDRIFSLAQIPDETGPECYSCEIADCSLKMPFSRIIFSHLESQREEFIEEMSVIKSNFDFEENEQLPKQVYSDLLVKQEKLASLSIPDWDQFCYETCEKDYIHDFCSMLSVNICSGMSREKRAYNMEWIVLQKTDLSQKTILGTSVCLHATAWMNISLFRSEMLLLAICEKVGIDKQVLTNMMRFKGLQSERISNAIVEERTNSDGNEISKSESGTDIVTDTDKNLEQTDMKQNSSESYTMNAEDYLVQDICKGMIPTKEIIDCYGGIDSWQRTVNAILALAAKVSVESQLLHVLRVCNEIAGNLIIPMQLNADAFFELGDILLSDTVDLDSKEVFDKIVEIISAGLKRNSSYRSNCYRVFSTYLVRCIMINPETEVLEFLFMYDLSNPIPDNMICHFRAPLYLAIDLDNDFDLFSNDKEENPGTVTDVSEGSNSYPDSEKRGFVKAFDKFLTYLATENRLDEPFVLLIVDLLADLFESSLHDEVLSNTSPDRFDTVYDCHRKIRDRQYGIGFVSAVAYVRSFISLLDKQHMWDYDMTREYWNAVNVLLSDFKSNPISSTLLTYFIKSISKGQTVLQLKMNVENKTENHDFLEQIVWSRGFPHFSFDGKPFCLLLDKTGHSKLDLCNDIQDIAKVEHTLMTYASDKCSDVNELLKVLSFTFIEYELTKEVSEKKDEMLMLLSRFANKVEAEKYSWHRVLKFLSGAEEFHCEGLDLEKQSKYLNYSAQCLLVQLFTLLLSHNVFEEENEKSVFIRCLTSTRSVKECFLPGFVDSATDYATKRDIHVGLATCNCGSRIAVHFDDAIKDIDCVFCSESLKHETICLGLKETGNGTRKPRTVWKFDDIPQGQFTVRGLHPVTIQLLQLILKGCILGSVAFDYSSIEEVKEVLGDEFKVSHLLKDITKHWSELSKLFNLDDYSMSNLLRVIVLETRDYFCKYTIVTDTETGRCEWERKFEVKLKEILGDRFNALKSKLRQHNKLHAVQDSSFENHLFETNDITRMSETERQSMLPLLFRVTSTPTRENFISEYMWRKSEFPFLGLILQFENKLSMPKHLYSIIQWHVTTVANINYMLKKHECLEMTVQEFFFLNPKKKDLLRTRFKAFQNAWNELRSFFKKTDFESEIKHVHEATKLKECILYNTDTVIFKVLEKLVQIQNEFLDTTLTIADRSDALHFLSVKEKVFVFPSVQITETRKEDLVHFEFENDTWDEILRVESLCRLEYGCGRETIYDFHSIEKMFAVKVLTGKSYIDFRYSVPNIIFADELYVNFADLVLKIKTRIKQKPLTDEIKESIQAKKNDNPKLVKELLSHLGILMTLLKKTGGDAETPLVDYVSLWSNVLSHEFPKDLLPNPETSVKLSHIIGLNELLEEICSETVLDALEKEYTEKLDDIACKHVIELLRDLQLANILLQSLKRFVYRGVFTQTADADRPICDYLIDNSFWPERCNKEKSIIKFGGKELAIQTLLPDYLMVRHVQSLIKQMEREIEKKQKEEETVHMREIARDFKQQRDRRNPQNKAMAKKARAKKFREY